VAGINVFAPRLPTHVRCQRDNSLFLGAILTFLKSQILIDSNLCSSPASYSDEGCGFFQVWAMYVCINLMVMYVCVNLMSMYICINLMGRY
jgi:hypothetical protein